MDTFIIIAYTLAIGSVLGYAAQLTNEKPKSFSPFINPTLKHTKPVVNPLTLPRKYNEKR